MAINSATASKELNLNCAIQNILKYSSVTSIKVVTTHVQTIISEEYLNSKSPDNASINALFKENLPTKSSIKPFTAIKVDNSKKIPEEILELKTHADITICTNRKLKEDGPAKSSPETSEAIEVNTSDNIPEDVLKMKGQKLTYEVPNYLTPEENLQLKKSIKTYENPTKRKRTIGIKISELNTSCEMQSVGIVLDSNEKLEVKATKNLVKNECYSCGICNKNFASHQMIEGDNSYICHTCNEANAEVVVGPIEKVQAEKSVKTDENLCIKNQCDICGISNKTFASHQMIKTEDSYICHVCSETCRLKTEELRNAVIHIKRENMCNFCCDFFKNSIELIRHVKSVHHVKKNKAFLCDVCNKQYMYLPVIISHREWHFLFAGNAKKDMITKGSRKYRVFTCAVCFKSFSEKIFLDVHSQVHTERKAYACIFCSLKFFRARDFKVHFHTMHPVKKTDFSCNLCPKKHMNEADFEDHFNNHHGLTPYKCKHCSMEFSEKRRLKCHQRTHFAEQYTCEFCPKVFSYSTTFKRHLKCHLNVRGFKCAICPKTFVSSGPLKKHLLSHTGEKPYVCDVCHKGFSISYNLRVHARIHTGERPFVCEICNKAFRVKLILNEHYKTHESKKKNATSD